MVRKASIEEISNCSTILVYGIGNQYKECHKLLKKLGIKNIVLFDGNSKKWDTTYEGYPIYAPDKIKDFIEDTSVLLIGCIYNQYEIASELLNKWQVPQKCIYMYTSLYYEKNIYNTTLIKENWSRIMECYNMFADEDSKKYYLNSINARLERNPFLLMPNPNCKKIGEYGEKLQLNRGDNIIDCGAYTGDTAALYMDRLDSDCKVFAIEPFQENYEKMVQRIRENEWQNKIIPYNYAIGNEKGTAHINYEKDTFDMAMNITKQVGSKHQTVEVESLDNLFATQKINYIKMDIEGEERAALEGARRVVEVNAPKMMISAYHKIEDFWVLPETIWSLNKNYQIYVGHAFNISTEMEYYCI